MRQVFRAIHEANSWGCAESVSGPGSTQDRASAFLGPLIDLIVRLEPTTLLDAPCGNFSWALPLSQAVPHYIGVDIVPALIRANRRLHGSSCCQFLCRDLVHDSIPSADVVLCRDCLVHLSTTDIWKALKNLRRTGARYFVTTTFIGDRANDEIETGGWRPLNLQRPPFGFPHALQLVDEQCLHTNGIYADKRLGLWLFRDVPMSQPDF